MSINQNNVYRRNIKENKKGISISLQKINKTQNESIKRKGQNNFKNTQKTMNKMAVVIPFSNYFKYK